MKRTGNCSLTPSKGPLSIKSIPCRRGCSTTEPARAHVISLLECKSCYKVEQSRLGIRVSFKSKKKHRLVDFGLHVPVFILSHNMKLISSCSRGWTFWKV